MVTAAAAVSLQSCPTVCDPTDGSPPGSPVPGLLQARVLQWAAIAFSKHDDWQIASTARPAITVLITSLPVQVGLQDVNSVPFHRENSFVGIT